MLKMKPDGGGRRTANEIKQRAREVYGVDLVAGFSRVSEFSTALRNREWVASFLDARAAYYLHLDQESVLQWESEPVPVNIKSNRAVFVIAMGMGNGSALPQPTGQFDLYINRTEYLLSICVVRENETWERNGVRFHYQIRRREVARPGIALKLDSHLQEESFATFGLGLISIPKEMLVPGQPVEFTLRPNSRQASKRWFKIDINMFARPILKAFLDDGLEAVCRGTERLTWKGKHLYFGDIHTHSGEAYCGSGTCGLGSARENYEYARHISNLDFFALTDHDWQVADETGWRAYLALADEMNESGAFVTLPAVEWTSARYGHRNIYFRDSNAPFVSCGPKNSIENSQTPAELWRQLRRARVQAITVPHHPQSGFFPMDWSYHDPEYERLVEIYSTWGNSESIDASQPSWASDNEPGLGVRDALNLGYRLGFVASSDGHDGHPGNAQWSYRQPHLGHWLGSGRVAVWADRLDREAIWQALYDRSCYATTGPRIVLQFAVDGAAMGSVLVPPQRAKSLKLTGYIRGTTRLDRVEIVGSTGIIESYRAPGTAELEFERDYDWRGESTSFYVRAVQEDGEMAWSSPVWVESRC